METLLDLPNFSDFTVPSKLKVIYEKGMTLWPMDYLRHTSKGTPKLKQLPFGTIVNIVSKEVVPYKTTKVSQDQKYLITEDGYGILYSRTDRAEPTLVFKLVQPEIEKTNNQNSDAQSGKQISDMVGGGLRKMQIGFAVVGWSAFGILAYKKWNKSKGWKIGLVAFGVLNAVNTIMIFSKPVFAGSGNQNKNTNTNSQSTDAQTTYNKIMQMISKMSKIPGSTPNSKTPPTLAEFTIKYNGYNATEKAALNEYLDGALKIDTSTGESAMAGFFTLSDALVNKYGEDTVKKIAQ